jgi:D-glycero-beta-D-manno-heptose 1-phosphate adenylyltransferase
VNQWNITEPSSKVMSLDEAVIWREGIRKQGRKLVVTNGCFDILHRGHAQYLYQTRCFGDSMLLLLNSDSSVRALKGPTRPIISEENRAYLIASLAFIDAVVIFDEPRCVEEFSKIQPDVYVKGGDYALDTLDNGEREALQGAGADIKFIPFIQGHSTTDILNIMADN